MLRRGVPSRRMNCWTMGWPGYIDGTVSALLVHEGREGHDVAPGAAFASARHWPSSALRKAVEVGPLDGCWAVAGDFGACPRWVDSAAVRVVAASSEGGGADLVRHAAWGPAVQPRSGRWVEPMALECVEHEEGLDGEPPLGQHRAWLRSKRHWSTDARKSDAIDVLASLGRWDGLGEGVPLARWVSSSMSSSLLAPMGVPSLLGLESCWRNTAQTLHASSKGAFSP